MQFAGYSRGRSWKAISCEASYQGSVSSHPRCTVPLVLCLKTENEKEYEGLEKTHLLYSNGGK